MIDPEGLLMIEPKGAASERPTVDELTRKMAALLRGSEVANRWRGFHVCACGAQSDNVDRYVAGTLSNSLAVHYLAFHRAEVPEIELEKVRALSALPVDPTAEELYGYGRKKDNRR